MTTGCSRTETARERAGLHIQRGRQTLERLKKKKWYVSFADVYSNSSLQFDIHQTLVFLIFFPLFGFSLTSLKEQAMFPRAQLFEAHSFGHPKFSVPTQAVQTLSPLTFPQWQGPGGQTIAALNSAHSRVASGRTTACFVCCCWPAIRETPQSLHGGCRTPCQNHYACLQWP